MGFSPASASLPDISANGTEKALQIRENLRRDFTFLEARPAARRKRKPNGKRALPASGRAMEGWMQQILSGRRLHENASLDPRRTAASALFNQEAHLAS
jgi:hypothetical protein